MGDFTRDVKRLLSRDGCSFVRHGKGDHEIWYTPILNRHFTVDGRIKKRSSANETLKSAGIKEKL
ncbi:MAG: type II toxin-antitoxin system HicA family toxin [Clostridiales bacterium]|nr:type II toxin-antitoxin system HicA family toxin [Clostridiales bacterium]